MSNLAPNRHDYHPGAALTLEAHAETLNRRFKHHSAHDVMQHALRDMGHVALVSSFGAESVVLLHMAARVDPGLPVLFIDTEMLFPETLAYQQTITEKLGLTGVLILRAGDTRHKDANDDLHTYDTDACCALRKTAPLQNALRSFEGWITGRKRFQAGTRAALDFFEVEKGSPRIKINPLAHWTPADVRDYMDENGLPKHPLVSQGYPSIGCAPCTSPVKEGEDPRAGRWRNTDKQECGIHFVNGKMVRTGV
ncbi:MAG: phosphoadenylyl-sulfate reductase [Aliishimia sp.]